MPAEDDLLVQAASVMISTMRSWPYSTHDNPESASQRSMGRSPALRSVERSSVRGLPVESGFRSFVAMSFWAPASRR